MDFEETKRRIAGPIAYPTTPFRKYGHGTVDEDTFRKGKKELRKVLEDLGVCVTDRSVQVR